MGNYRFRLSEMIPNSWFYKLKDMSKSKKQYSSSHPFKKNPQSSASTASSQKSSFSHLPTYSYYFTELCRSDKFSYHSGAETADGFFPDQPRKSHRRISRRKAIYKPDFHGYPLSESEEDEGFHVPDSRFDHQVASYPTSGDCKVTSSNSDIIIDVNCDSFERKTENSDGFDPIPELQLPPMLTTTAKFHNQIGNSKFKKTSSELKDRSLSVKIVKEASIRTNKDRKINHSSRRSSSSSSPGIRLRSNTPRIGSRKIQARKGTSTIPSRRNQTSLSESLAVVKFSVDPVRDFRESMVEMIQGHDIRATKDLEELLACYLSLNCEEYHDLIVKAFEQIWFDDISLPVNTF